MDAKKFGDFIAQCRKENNMTQAQLAGLLHVTDKAVSRWERGLGFPDINTIEPLADALGISVLELMKSERITEAAIPSREAAEIVLDALNATEQQRRQELRNTALIFRLLLVLVIVFLLVDNIQWDLEMTLFTLVGVGLPLFCVFGLTALSIYGIRRKTAGKTSRRTFLLALVLLLALALMAGLFFLAGAAGIGPVPN